MRTFVRGGARFLLLIGASWALIVGITLISRVDVGTGSWFAGVACLIVGQLGSVYLLLLGSPVEEPDVELDVPHVGFIDMKATFVDVGVIGWRNYPGCECGWTGPTEAGDTNGYRRAAEQMRAHLSNPRTVEVAA